MPWFLGFFRGLFVLAKPLLMHVLIAIGVGTISYVGSSELFDYALEQIQAQIAEMPIQAIQLLNVCGVDNYFSIVFSAITIRLTLSGLMAGGVIRKTYWTGGQPIVLN